MSKDGGAAFPKQPIVRHYGGEIVMEQGGMSLRDYFAAAAMKGFISSGQSAAADFNSEWEGYKGGIPEEFATVARESYLMADAMLAAREVKP